MFQVLYSKKNKNVYLHIFMISKKKKFNTGFEIIYRVCRFSYMIYYIHDNLYFKYLCIIIIILCYERNSKLFVISNILMIYGIKCHTNILLVQNLTSVNSSYVSRTIFQFFFFFFREKK